MCSTESERFVPSWVEGLRGEGEVREGRRRGERGERRREEIEERITEGERQHTGNDTVTEGYGNPIRGKTANRRSDML